jgi:hypothetical protein
MKNLFIAVIGTFLSISLQAQNVTQTIKGQILDKQSEIPIIGATIQWLNDENTLGDITDVEGYFKLENIPVGRQAFQISYLGYETLTLPNVEVTAGKEVVLNLTMVESVELLNEVVVTAETQKDRAINEMATISARTFSLEEVNRYAGGRSDVARLAGNFAGVATADDSRNDIVIRGNSPTGILWRLEGIPIPNPNHFSTLGSTGGPVSAMNPNVLKNSDFLTSAFPAEYGNATSGVFDLGMRSGNRDKNEFTFQMGAFSGLEGMAEGPLGKKGGSYLVAVRNSFIAIISPPQTAAIPNYFDVTFKIDSHTGKFGKFSLFGIGGTSSIDFVGADIDSTDLFSEVDQDLFPRSRFGVVGLRHNKIIGNDSYIRTVIAGSLTRNEYAVDRYFNLGTTEETKIRYADGNNEENRLSISSFFNKKFNSKATMRVGVLAEQNNYDLINRDAERAPDLDGDGYNDIRTDYEFEESVFTIQPFAQVQYKFKPKWVLNLGVHGLYQEINDQFVLEPRTSLSWNFAKKQKLTFGYGLHSQNVPLPIMLNASTDAAGNRILTNTDLNFSRNQHFVLGYDYAFANNWRAKVEAYYQAIDQVAVDSDPSSFSLLNLGSDFGFPAGKVNLTNEGTGFNQGVEVTVEKFFSKGFHGLLTASFFESKYEGSDGVERNTAFNNNYVINLLAGREIKVGKAKQNAILIDTKLTSAGGRYYTPVDLEASKLVGFEIRNEALAFSEKYDDYFRWDVKIGFKLNSKKRKISQQIYLDFQNITNRKNIFSRDYNRLTNEVNVRYQIGFFPDFLYRIQF